GVSWGFPDTQGNEAHCTTKKRCMEMRDRRKTVLPVQWCERSHLPPFFVLHIVHSLLIHIFRLTVTLNRPVPSFSINSCTKLLYWLQVKSTCPFTQFNEIYEISFEKMLLLSFTFCICVLSTFRNAQQSEVSILKSFKS